MNPEPKKTKVVNPWKLRIYKDGTKVAIEPGYSHMNQAYRLVCKLCGVAMVDMEPFSRRGEHIHPRIIKGEVSKCIHSGEAVFAPGEFKHSDRGSRWVSVFRPKKYRRARKRSAKTRAKLGRS